MVEIYIFKMSLLALNLAIVLMQYDTLFSFFIMASAWSLHDRQSFKCTPGCLQEDTLSTSTPLLTTAGSGEAVLKNL